MSSTKSGNWEPDTAQIVGLVIAGVGLITSAIGGYFAFLQYKGAVKSRRTALEGPRFTYETVPQSFTTPFVTDFVPEPVLPASFRRKGAVPEQMYQNQYFAQRAAVCTVDQTSSTSIDDFLSSDLSIDRLDRIQSLLGWTSSDDVLLPSLHNQVGDYARRIIITNRLDLHLVCKDSVLYIKPLPGFLLNLDYWNHYLLPGDYQRWRNAIGFLFSYIDLIQSDLDFDIAIDTSTHARLLPLKNDQQLTYKDWQNFVAEFQKDSLQWTEHLLATRWEYGVLNLDRLNAIYRFRAFHLRRFGLKFLREGGYHVRPMYTPTTQRNIFAWVVFLFAYVSAVLSAMQVGKNTTQLSKNRAFNNASYGLVVLMTIVPLVGVVLMLSIRPLVVLGTKVLDYFISATITHPSHRQNDYGISPGPNDYGYSHSQNVYGIPLQSNLSATNQRIAGTVTSNSATQLQPVAPTLSRAPSSYGQRAPSPV